jgi:transposase
MVLGLDASRAVSPASEEVKGLRAETHQPKELLAELMMENRLLKKSVLADGELDNNFSDREFVFP